MTMQTGTLRGAVAALLLLAGCARPAPAPAPADAPRALRFRRPVDGTGRVIDDAVVADRR